MDTSSQAHLLIAEDNEETCLLLRHQLSEHFNLTIASSVDKALALADARAYDLLILDINLGGKRSGVDLLQELRTRDALAHVPALALTAYAMPGDKEHFLSAGFDGYIGKPFSRADLIEAIEDALSARE